ncbi:hypothetical protein GJ744_005492 [Endocarpon pusillum]|uniref:SET domain-containing protein n=1 Tax=Endocarpon pusillum TaxID=364733 RepID=A0A8H7A5K1_9EURO|nr:hypothetical protein GJ744_005492 [Endocarpon pusillum]
MDVKDVSESGPYFKLLEQQKKTLQTAQKRKGERPRDAKPRSKIIDDHMMQSMTMHMRELSPSSNDNHMIHSSFLAPPYTPSVAPFKALKKMPLKDLRLETHHRGLYVLLRVVTPPTRMTAIMAVMEDEADQAVMVQLYQQEEEKYRPARVSVKKWGVCIVKEPYFKVMGDGDYGLRIDHVSDLIWLSETDDRVPLQWRPQISQLGKTADEWKSEGNNALKSGDCFDAAEKYTLALQCPTTSEEARIIKMNRALTNLKLRRYDAALLDAGWGPPDVKPLEKGLYRAARALYALGRFPDCYDTLNVLLKEYPGNEEGRKELSRVKNRLTEQKHGRYDFKAMYAATNIRPLDLDHATYIGPVVVKPAEGRGRGLFTTKGVKAGELLLCEKAFSQCYADPGDSSESSSSKISLLINAHTNRMVMGTHADLITKIVQQLWRNPSLAPAFTSLHHGSYKPVQVTYVDDMPVVDTFLVDRIISLNAFGFPLTSLSSHLGRGSPDDEQKEKDYHSCGIWVQASYINHSCYSNVRRSFIGDMQIIRAVRDIPADTELTFWYQVPNTEGYDKRQQKLQNWGFQCQCVMCTEEKNTPKNTIKKREGLLGDLKAAFRAPSGAQLPKVERLLTALDKTYQASAARVPRLALWDPYLLLTRMYAAQNLSEKVIATTLKVLASLGFVIKGAEMTPSAKSTRSTPANAAFVIEQWGLANDYVVEAWVHLWKAYMHVAPQLSGQAEECARTAYRICVGEDVTFDQHYP